MLISLADSYSEDEYLIGVTDLETEDTFLLLDGTAPPAEMLS